MIRRLLASFITFPRVAGLAPLAAGAFAVAMSATPAMGAEAGAIRTFVWRVEAPGARPGATPDRLLGTMHVPIRPGRKLPGRVEGWVKGARRFVMEVDLHGADPMVLRKYAALEPGQDLRALLPAAAWPKLLKLTAPHGLDEADLRVLDPWYVALTFLPTSGDSGTLMDSRLRELAEGARVPVAFLERAEDQMKALDAVAMKEDLAQLLEVIEDPGKPAEELAQLARAYEAGDLQAVEKYLFEPARVAAYPDFYEKVFHRRNRTWMPAIERYFRRDDAFVAVGLGHLLGDQGLLALLTKRGWRVTREPGV
jgi:uncharacterized protein YbaP (TraB family)